MPDATRPAPPRPKPVPVSTRPPPHPSTHQSSSSSQGRRTSDSAQGGGGGSSSRTIKVGQYELGNTLGVGSFGKVKLATHSITGHKVAMKIINRRKIQNMDMTSRVKREIQYLKVLRHPHIIKLYEVITTPTDIIMVIEYAGGELFNYIVEKVRMTEDEARRFFQQIICAIEYCHRHKIVHRDLKPENLLLDDYLNVKIGDFGLSNIMTDGDFLKTSCGSPNYAAPEVISGKLYAGPEIDIWSCGVILYVMLCGRLPFDDDYIPKLFQKINGGIYHLPSHLSDEARHLLSRMLVVDPVKRITISEIRQLPWFQKNLPKYLAPLPQTPGVDRPSASEEMAALLGQSGVSTPPADLGADPNSEEGMMKLAELKGLLYVPDLGVVEPKIVDELCEKMAEFDRTSIWEALKREGDNQVKVAYQLVRDHKRMLQDSADLDLDQDDDHVMESFLASSPPPWNAGLENAMGRSTSIKRKPGKGQAPEETEEELWDEDEDMEIEDIPDSNFETLETSLPGRLDENGELIPTYDVLTLQSQSLTSQEDVARAAHQAVSQHRSGKSKPSKSRWHFGIRSRSPPMEVMHEIYKTLQVIGMQWKKKQCFEGPWDAEGRPQKTYPAGMSREQKQKEKQGEEKQNQALYFVETRCKIDTVVIRMDLQLYRVDQNNYLVDFRNVGYYRSNSDPEDFSRRRRSSNATDVLSITGSSDSRRSSVDHSVTSPTRAAMNSNMNAGVGGVSETSAKEGSIKEVSSPFLFLEAACRLIVELASG